MPFGMRGLGVQRSWFLLKLFDMRSNERRYTVQNLERSCCIHTQWRILLGFFSVAVLSPVITT